MKTILVILSLVAVAMCLMGCNNAADREAIPTSSDVEEIAIENQEISGVVNYSDLDEIPKLLTKISPVYPEDARKAGMEGTVYIKILIDETGGIIKTNVAKSSGDISLDNSALEALKTVKFSAGKKEGETVKVWMTLPIKYALSKDDKK